MRILIASDKFKGSLTATQVAQTIQRSLLADAPDIEFDLCPIADGGEGTTEAMVTAMNGEWITTSVLDAQDRLIQAKYGWVNDRAEAVMEMSAASGLALVADLPLNPDTASTKGTGMLLKAAMDRGAKAIIIGIGGSATNDGGFGMAAALGYRFLDSEGDPVVPIPANLMNVAGIEPPSPPQPAKWPQILVACDVDNPLLGQKGATRIYGPQKGVTDYALFEARLQHLADLVARDLHVDPRHTPGAGAAGGLGFGLMAFCQARLTSGFDLVADQVRLSERIADADLVITGEGRLDAQTLHGKGPAGVAQMARKFGKPIVAFAGSIEESADLHSLFNLAFSIKPQHMNLNEAIQRAAELLAQAVHTSAPQIRSLLGLA